MRNLLGTIYLNEPDLLSQVKSYIDQGDDLNEATVYGESALRVASNHGRFDVVKLLLNSGADRNQLEWSDLIFAVIYGTLEDVRQAVQDGNSLESVDFWSRTPLLFAIQLGDTEKATLLLALGANRNATGRCGKTPIQYAIQSNDLPMLQWLLDQGYDIESVDESLNTAVMTAAEMGKAACLEFLIARGADIHKLNSMPYNAMREASTIEVVRILLAHGADVNDLSPEMHAILLGVSHDAEIQSDFEQYREGRFRRFGQSNPEKMIIPFWISMIRSGANAWRARQAFPDVDDMCKQPVWTYDRFGRTTTILPDGRIVEIGGEHEDYYDPDFCIYNDVTVFNTDGTIQIYSYPEDIFPATDFHSATLWRNSIVIIGNLGYSHSRSIGHTAVFRLDLDTFVVEKIDTKGSSPGWIHRHKAVLNANNQIAISGGYIVCSYALPFWENIEEWLLDPATWAWSRTTNRKWPQWDFVRTDRRTNHLWEIRHALWYREANWKSDFETAMNELTSKLGHEPDLDSLASLYLLGESHESGLLPEKRGQEIRVQLDGIVVRLDEGHRSIHVVVEGMLPDARIKAFQDSVLLRLERLEGVAWETLGISY